MDLFTPAEINPFRLVDYVTDYPLVTLVTSDRINRPPTPYAAPAVTGTLCYPASIDVSDLAYFHRHGRMVLQRLGRHRLPGADQKVAASRRIHGAVLRHAGD